MEAFQPRLRALSPTERRPALAPVARPGTQPTRWRSHAGWRLTEQKNTLPTPFLVVLVFWLTAMFASFGLFSPRNAIALAVLFVGALSLVCLDLPD